MTSLGAFFRLAARPAVFYFFVISFAIFVLVRELMSKVFPGLGADLLIVNAFVFPALVGVIGGQLVYELQHSTFTWTLPGVARRTLGGFVAAGAILGLFTTAVLATAGRPSPAVFAVALAGYCLGNVLFDPLGWAALVILPTALLVLIFSRAVGEYADTRPGAVVAVAGVVCGLCLWRMFSKSTFRRRVFVPTPPTSEPYHPASAARFRRELLVASGPKRRRWAGTYLGTDLGRWTRAAAYESYGSLGPKDVIHKGFWPVLIVSAHLAILHAKLEADGGTFLETPWATVYHAFLRPPDMPSFIEKGAYGVIPFLICLVGLMLVSSVPAALTPGRLYPLSRRELGRLAYRGYLAPTLAYCLVVVAFSLGLGLVAGYLAGYELRLDFVPLWLRALLWTLAVLPLVQWFQVRAREEENRRSSEAGLVRITRIFLTVVGICLVPLISVLLPPSPLELAVVAALIVAGQAIFRQWALRYFATADLA